MYPRSWRTNALFLIVFWMILLVSSLTVLSSTVTPFLKTLQIQNLVSVDWAGYSVSSDNLFPQPLVSGVSGSWRVPQVAVTAGDTFSSAWIGIGGQGDNTLIQVGSLHESVGGRVSYGVWYEMLPDNAIPISHIAVSAGDEISASITLADRDANIWAVEIKDVTTGQGFRQNFGYNSSMRTAEWIVERPLVNSKMSTLADFGTVTFTDAKAQVGDKTGTITAFYSSKIHMQDHQNNVLVTVSELSQDGSSFSVNYG
ncbi:MAG: G1 family endopeptidase [Candidatus Bathyarchaeota archaeon]|nr:G1 family endopeptidase [Candidatus Bathyarchaeota archaeon]